MTVLHEKSSGTIDLSVVLSLHREGPLVAATLQSLRQAMRFATAARLTIELVVVLDDVDQATRDQLARAALSDVVDVQVIECAHRSLGLSRNAGANAASGAWICFADGDDLVSVNTFAAFVQFGRRTPANTILMPQWLLTFGEENRIGLVLPSRDIGALNLLSSNPFVSRICLRREAMAALPFVNADAASGHAFEDWHHHCEAIAAGFELETVPDTILFYRIRKDGLNASAQDAARVIAPSRLFRPDIFLDRCASDDRRRGRDRTACHLRSARAFGNDLHVDLVGEASAIEPAIAWKKYDVRDAFISMSPYHKSVGALYFEICRALGRASFERIELFGSDVDDRPLPQDVPVLRICVTHDAGSPFADVDTRAGSPHSSIVRLGHDRAACESLTIKLIQTWGAEATLAFDASDFCVRFAARFRKVLEASMPPSQRTVES